MNNIIISAITIKRLISDIKEIVKNPLSKDGIFYKHDETNMLVGYALIIGPEDTPYSFGNFLFQFDFPTDYPHSPPTVTYCTNDGITRFHPNLYKNGKVCLSVLNTWKGEQWTGCQTIKSILLTLCSIFNNIPLLNEPGIMITHKDVKPYNKIIRYKTYSIAIQKILSKEFLPDQFDIFYDDIIANFLINYDKIQTDLDALSTENCTNISTGVYNLCVKINYPRLKNLLKKQFNLHNKIHISNSIEHEI
jgi:ubiquitin-protein ligase